MEKNKKKLLKCRNKFDDNNSTNENNSNQEQPTKSPKSCNDDNDDVKKVEEIIVCPGSDEEANDDDDDDKNGHFNHRSQEQQQQRPQFRSSLERGIIPDAKTIYELKKRRQKMALTADFIPLENESGNRQVRDSDDDKSENDDDDLLPNSDCDDHDDDDDKDRIQFGNVDYESKDKEKFRECFRVAQEQQQQQQKNENQKQKQNNDSSSSGDDDDHDDDADNNENEESEEEEDEMDKWEREQIRKAVRMPNIYHLARSEMNNKFLTTMDDKTLLNKLQVIHDNHSIVPIEIDQMDYRSYGNNIPSYIVDLSTDNNNDNDDLNFDSFTDRIHSMRKQIETTIDENQQLLNRIMMDLKLSKNDIEKYNIIDVVEMTDEYNLYRNLYDYIRNLFDCINDKMIELEKNEHGIMNVYCNYAEHQLNEHRTNIQDQNSISLYLIMNHKTLCQQYSSYDNNNQLTSVLDVYHFDDNDQIKRNRCYKRLENLKKKKTNEDDDENPERKSLDEELKSFRLELDKLFDDTDDDFASINGICKQFQKWKLKNIQTYKESFIMEFLPKFLAYYLRYDFALWNIFLDPKSNNIDLINMDAIQELIRYCYSNKQDELIDLNVIPILIDQVIIMKLIEMIEKDIWNPLSIKQTDCFVRFLRLTITNFPTLVDISENFSKLLQTIVKRMEKTIENDIFIPQMIPMEFFNDNDDDDPNVKSYYENLVIEYIIEFFHHQYMETIQLMKNILSFRNIISEQILFEFVMEKLCFRYILTSIQRLAVDNNLKKTLEFLNNLIMIIPNEWLKKSSNFNTFIQQLFERSKSNPKCTNEIRQKFQSLLYQINR
uniref:PAX3- and PAX7-binding protein 1-like n=1 Tax=Dermatophagoides pteronyssinus TaxID=6956 RepID=A0A6P6XRY1_DERPT|nr:PAX3- and PAX7-binding protein 1-like [Dermatophagoides pteronyssinus]